jgi:dTDP-4-amino-4,6-dideoxygalactose transaminase
VSTVAVNVPLLDLKAQYASMKGEIAAAINEVVESQHFIMGPVIQALEKEIAAYCGAKHAIGCASGSDALLLALMALGVGPGDEVICPSYTFFATGGSIARIGAKPIYADIDPATYNMDPAHVGALARKCKRLKAIMPVHLYGQAADMDAYLDLGREFGVPIIEDAAQAIGTLDAGGALVGSRGTIGCFSFFPSKNLGGFGDGGIMTTNDDRLADLLGILRVHGGKPKYYHKVIGINSRLDALQAAVLRVKLRHLDSWHAGRAKNAAFYDRAFAEAGASTSASSMAEADLPVLTPQPASAPARHIYNQYVIRVPAAQRDELRDRLTKAGVGTEIYYPVPLHLQECFAYLGGAKGDLPESEAAANETIALPIYPELTRAQLQHVVNAVVDFLRAAAPARAAAGAR